MIDEAMGTAQPEVWVSDLFTAQLAHPARAAQICLAHQMRDLQDVIDAHHWAWAQEMQTLFQQAMQFDRQREPATETHPPDEIAQFEQWLDDVLARPPDHPDSERLRRRFVQHRQALLLFLHRADVPPTNNAAAQA